MPPAQMLPLHHQGMMPRAPSATPMAPQPIGMPPGFQMMGTDAPVPFPMSLPGMIPGPGLQQSPWLHPGGMMGLGMMPDPAIMGVVGAVPQMQMQLMPDGSFVPVPVPLPPPFVPQPRWLDENGLMTYQADPLKVCGGRQTVWLCVYSSAGCSACPFSCHPPPRPCLPPPFPPSGGQGAPLAPVRSRQGDHCHVPPVAHGGECGGARRGRQPDLPPGY